MALDLLIKGVRVADPAQGLDQVLDVAFSGCKITRLAPTIAAFYNCGHLRLNTLSTIAAPLR